MNIANWAINTWVRIISDSIKIIPLGSCSWPPWVERARHWGCQNTQTLRKRYLLPRVNKKILLRPELHIFKFSCGLVFLWTSFPCPMPLRKQIETWLSSATGIEFRKIEATARMTQRQILPRYVFSGLLSLGILAEIWNASSVEIMLFGGSKMACAHTY